MNDFNDLYDQIYSRTIIPKSKLYALYHYALDATKKLGAIAEVGVYLGGTSILLKKAFPDRKVYAFDTFCGIPAVDDIDGVHLGEFTIPDPESTILSLQQESILVRRGIFPGTAPDEEVYCFAHFDGDTYKSCVDFISYFYPRMTIGGIMVFDDYGWERCRGVEKAISEFFSGKSEIVISSHLYQCAVVKI